MASLKRPVFQFLFLALCSAAFLVQDATGSRAQILFHNQSGGHHRISSEEREINLKDVSKRVLIGSVAPTCTYNECRGCKYKCRAEQVPVEGNDPINSPYHYKFQDAQVLGYFVQVLLVKQILVVSVFFFLPVMYGLVIGA
ncbi:EPIDERMAL PATTERNING FACTOR-like protein 9 [Sesamum angolense]|uniref:EPIDERMAL PATTERNING FACTOR-like protein 9 n=1 Tax=Sesamum angolense TaxID=2727404 RepID=A0AAE1XCZ5_9LAMI|nr:EPIDERMAL PATTERNING FACTOR-like protein 9 [Sesamum angolense]